MTAHPLDRAVEALIFAAEEPPTAAELARAYARVTGADVAAADVDAAVGRLNAAYREGGRAFRIHRWGRAYRMATVEDVAPFVQALLTEEEEKRLSRALVETLAVVAYKQPVSKPEIDHVRGVNADYALRQLLERELITVVGRSEGVGRPLLYGTTEHFLDQFGLGTLEELPRPREVEELLADPAFSRERAVLMTEMEALRAQEAGEGEAAPEPPPAEGASAEAEPADA
ncbi:MAG TPA: SMC-Scp complex subunit ScpB [Rubricoccaceae bacterium]|nr:SMC-Scp complex subunit ScpB [Rubricoccaceae bacterium]